MSRPILTFVTGNANKLKEVQAILATNPDFPFQLVSRDLDLPEIQGTTQQVARAKCKAAAQIIQGPCITEDTALCFDALGGLPGAYIKDFLKVLGTKGLPTLLTGFPTNSASALCTFCYSPGPSSPSSSPSGKASDSEIQLFEGITRGKIVESRGPQDFGWDSCFQVEGSDKTYAEMEKTEKNKISHRYKSLALLQDYLCSLPTPHNSA